MERLFSGAYAIVLTPFKDDGTVDYETLENYAAKAADSPDLDGLVMCGSTGEFTRLDFSENVEIMKIAVRASGGRKKVICGATAGDSRTACKYVYEITKIGADGILAAPPYYFKLNDDEISAYYSEIMRADEGELPIIGYNIPQCTNPVSVNVFSRLLEYDLLKGFKNSWNDMSEITAEIALRDEKRPDVAMFTGLDACLYGTLALGGDGIFSAITYLMPEIIGCICKNYGKDKKAFECQCELIKLINEVNKFTFPYSYRLLSKAVDMPLGEGREAIPASVAAASRESEKVMREIYARLKEKYA